MKKIISIFLSRGVLITISFTVQILLWALLFHFFKDREALLITSLGLISFLCTMYIVIQDIYPEKKIAWLIFMILFPVPGGVFYLIFGSHKIDKKTKRIFKQIEKETHDAVSKLPEVELDDNIVATRNMKYLKNMANAPVYKNTKVDFYKIGEEKFNSMLEELQKAEKFIFLEYFIIEQGLMWNSIEKILIEKAKCGVEVRVLYDDLGCLLTLPKNFCKRLKRHNIDCKIFNKFTNVRNSNFNTRDHRKICVIDGNVGFVGGINLADEYINKKVKHGHWKDSAIKLTGDAVYSLSIMFLSMWSLETKKVENFSKYAPTIKVKGEAFIQPYGDSPLDNESVGENTYINILNTAKKYVYITSPYLVISKTMSIAIENAAKSGIDVRLMLPRIQDKKFVKFISKSYYEPLINAGVKIYEYKPGFVHSKMFIADDETAVVGTINLDYRSLDLHYECAVYIYKDKVIKDIKEDFLETQEICELITMEKHRKQNKLGFIQFLYLGFLKIFSPLF